MPIEESTVGNDVEFLSEIMEMNETLENGSDDMLRKLKSQIEGKSSWTASSSIRIQVLLINATTSVGFFTMLSLNSHGTLYAKILKLMWQQYQT